MSFLFTPSKTLPALELFPLASLFLLSISSNMADHSLLSFLYRQKQLPWQRVIRCKQCSARWNKGGVEIDHSVRKTRNEHSALRLILIDMSIDMNMLRYATRR